MVKINTVAVYTGLSGSLESNIFRNLKKESSNGQPVLLLVPFSVVNDASLPLLRAQRKR